MDNDKYKPPSSDVELPVNNQGSSFKAIFYGAFTDIGGTLIFSVLFGIAYSTVLAGQGLTESEMISKMGSIDLYSPIGLFTSFVGVLISAVAGYVCAKNSVVKVYKDASILCFISCSFGIIVGIDAYPLTDIIIMTIFTAIAIFFGADYWCRKMVKKSSSS